MGILIPQVGRIQGQPRFQASNMAVLEFFNFRMARGSGHIGQNRIYPGFLRSGSVFFAQVLW